MADTDSCASLEMAAHAPTMRLELKEHTEKTDAKELEEKAGEKRTSIKLEADNDNDSMASQEDLEEAPAQRFELKEQPEKNTNNELSDKSDPKEVTQKTDEKEQVEIIAEKMDSQKETKNTQKDGGKSVDSNAGSNKEHSNKEQLEHDAVKQENNNNQAKTAANNSNEIITDNPPGSKTEALADAKSTPTTPGHAKQRDPSFVHTMKKEVKSLEEAQPHLTKTPNTKKRRHKKGIYISYSPDAGFTERRFVVETIKQFKENNLADDIWFDKDEGTTDSATWFASRMEAVEKCKAAVLILSDSYFTCPVSMYEGKALLERKHDNPSSVAIYSVLFSLVDDIDIPRAFGDLLMTGVDLTSTPYLRMSLAEKSSLVVGSLMVELEQHASILTPSFNQQGTNGNDEEFSGEYKTKKICQWNVADLQEWLFALGVKEFYRQSLAENSVDGFLLMSLTDQDMIHQLSIDSRAVRKKIMQHILLTLDKEHKSPSSWHLRSRSQRPRANCVYVIYDPADLRLANNLKQDLTKKNLQVLHHQKLGQTKDEFLEGMGPQVALATTILLVMTENAVQSPFVFHEVMFADWLGKKLVVAMFKNTWQQLRPSLRALLGECPTIDFESKMYPESMSILEHHIRPIRGVPGVVLEQAYLNKMADGLKPFSMLANTNVKWAGTKFSESRVFISYQWDMQARVEDIRRMLENNGLSCWTDITPTVNSQPPQPPNTQASQQRGHSSVSMRSNNANLEQGGENLQSHIQRTMKSAALVMCCITPKYMQSDNCVKDLTLAETLHKPIVPVMLRFCPWPPEGSPAHVRKILAKHHPIDLSNDKLYKQNLVSLLDKVKKLSAK